MGYDMRGYRIKENPVIMGIESSCDDTACAVLRGRDVLSDVIISSADVMAEYGGVVPEIASRAHTDAIGVATAKALAEAGIAPRDMDAVAVTYGAGLLGSLLVGLSFAKSFAYSLNIPLIGVSHIRGHIASAYITCPSLKPPFVALLASGGHTAIMYIKDDVSFDTVASTCDDAAGEAFDKCARILSLPYPGGPNIQRLAREGKPCIPFPSAEVRDRTTLRFSYSGLKTAVMNYCHGAEQRGENIDAPSVAASFQKAALDPLIKRTVEAAVKYGTGCVTVGGGVAANDYLRDGLRRECSGEGIKLVLPEKRHCTDNAVMIASEGLNKYMRGEFDDMSLNAAARVPLDGR